LIKRRQKTFSFTRFSIKLVIVICLFSALPMLFLRYVDPTTSSFILQNERSAGRSASMQWTPLEHISESLQLAVMASEDQKFPFHRGLDVIQIRNAFAVNQNRIRPLGASTITQQTIKNLFLWSGQSYVRKGVEAWLALWLELIVPKYRILEIYVNIAQWGPTHYGAEVAAQRYFDISASDLNDQQAALLAASLPSPSRSTPDQPSEYLTAQANKVLAIIPTLRTQGYIVGLYL
jgi:monofunctional glycosyltransferase